MQLKVNLFFSQEWSTWYKLRKWKRCTGESVWPKCPKFKKQHIEKMKNSEQKWEHVGEVMTKQWRPSAGNTFQWSSGTLQVLSILSPLNQTLALTGGTKQSSLSENTTQKHTTPFKFTTPESKSNWKNEQDYAKSTANKDKGKHHQESWENNRLNVEHE